ncbi:MAG: S8 family serine peptidase [Phycisphaerales bacterium]|nr:MAG: S8 family serine peptidase [Phycisphaerales bacterium]
MILNESSRWTAWPFAWLGIVVVLCATAVAGAQKPAREPVEPSLAQSPTYFYDAGGKRAITESETEWLVHVPMGKRDGADAAERPAFLPPRVVAAELPESTRRLEEHMEARGFHVVRGGDRAGVDDLPGVAYTLPVLYRVGGSAPLYLTADIIAQFRHDVNEARIRAVADSVGCALTRCRWGERRYILTVRDVTAVHPVAVANYLHERPDLTRYAHPDFFVPKVTFSPPIINDPYYLSHQWHLDGDVLKGADANSDVNVETAWDSIHGPTAQGSPTVRVSILDECVEKWHPDLFPNFAAGIDLDHDPPDDDPSPDAGQRHGTACAGLAVAKGNTIGVRGAAPECGLIGVKFFGATISEMADGFYFSVDPDNNGDHSDGASVLSNSWGFADGTLQPPDVVAAINFAAVSGRNGLGCLVLFAAGNDDHTVNGLSALGQLPTTMSVGGTNSHAKHTEFSNVGPEVGITAPTNDRGDDGVREPWLNITTVDNQGSSGYNGLDDLDYTDEFGGTSAATPLAAGVLALILSQDETLTAVGARAILQHTAARPDAPYGRFDGISSHSHRFGYGRCDAGAAVAAAAAGRRWPDRIDNLNASPTGDDVTLTWDTPANDYAGSLLVRSDRPFAWTPTDGETYNLYDVVAPGVEVIYVGFGGVHVDVGASAGGFFYGVYPHSAARYWGFGAAAHVIRDGIVVFQDNSEGADPGWTHGGAGDEWTRGTPTSAPSIFSQLVTGSGPLAGLAGTRAIGGDQCWGTDLNSIYDAGADAYLQTPLINLTGVSAPVFLEYYDWCLLETFYDRCTVEVVDADDNFLGYLDPDTGGDYDWTLRVLDLTPFAVKPIKVRFRITSDAILQRDGWFIDDVRITVAGNVPLPPLARDVYVETTENTAVDVLLIGSDPNPGSVLSYVITSLPPHGTLYDPNGSGSGEITSVPYTLAANGPAVSFDPATDYQGPDSFTYRVTDGGLESNQAEVSLSIGTPTTIDSHPLDTDPGWITEGDWAFGVPLGLGGDPSSGYTGVNVYGYNLGGAYPDDLPPRHLTTLPMNCAGLSRVTLDFARWLGVEAGSFDNASIAVSSDGVLWETVWAHSGDDLVETSWSLQSYNIGAVADDEPFVQVRWTMGPTDGNTTFAGWNLDDIEIRAIGTPQGNQPPLARAIHVETAENIPVDVVLEATDADGDPLTYTIVELPASGALFDSNGVEITAAPYPLAGGGRVVTYQPDPGFTDLDGLAYRADDGSLDSNVAAVTILVIDSAPFPYTDGFEFGPALAGHWVAASTNVGRILVTDENGPIGSYHVTMDSALAGAYSLNELTLAIDLEGASNVLLEYSWRDFGDEADPLPASWDGSFEGDGVAVSEDGVTWHRIADLFDATRTDGDEDADGAIWPRAGWYQTVTLDLDAAVAAAGIGYNKTFRIRFQQYDNNPIATDGIAIDNVGVLQGTDDPQIVTTALPPGTVGDPYGPVMIDTIGGDPPLIWSAPIVYGEESLGDSLFATNGVAQNWHGDDLVFDHPLPFTFTFYGQTYSSIRIATDGWINFGPHVGSTYNNSAVLLAANVRIAVLWDDLRTDIGNSDIYIDESVSGQIAVRWAAVTRSADNQPCNFSATLFDDGRMRFDYGGGNTPLTATVGVSAGDSERYYLASYDAQPDLGNVDSLMLDFSRLPPGLGLDASGVVSGTPTDAGAYKPIFAIEDQSGRTDSKMLPIIVTTGVFGDYDQDGDTDLDDFPWFVSCLEQIEPSPECLDVFDDDGNGSIDLRDYAMFQLAFTGPM